MSSAAVTAQMATAGARPFFCFQTQSIAEQDRAASGMLR